MKTPRPCDRSHSGATIAGLNAHLEQRDCEQTTGWEKLCQEESRLSKINFLHDNVTHNHTCRNLDDLMAEVLVYLRRRKSLKK